MATLYAWTGALRKRGELDGLVELVEFANTLEEASRKTIEDGVMTKDLAQISELTDRKIVSTESFLLEVKQKLDELYQKYKLRKG